LKMSIKDQLIALQLELEDKTKVAALLEKRVERARDEFATAVHEISRRYEEETQQENDKQKKIIDAITEKTQELVEEKSQLLNDLKDRIADVQQLEHDLQADIRCVFREADKDLEQERKRFKTGYEERLQKVDLLWFLLFDGNDNVDGLTQFMSVRAEEIKESTAKAMEPEYQRLQSMHERDISESELSFQKEERNLQNNARSQLESAIEEERQQSKEEMKYSLQSLQDKVVREIEALTREQKLKQRQVIEDHDREQEKLNAVHQDKLNKARKGYYKELDDLQHGAQQRLLDLKKSHQLHIENVSKEHDDAMRRVRRQCIEDKARMQSYVRSQTASGEPIDLSGFLLEPLSPAKKRGGSSASESKPTSGGDISSPMVGVLMDDDSDDGDMERARPPISPSRLMVKQPTSSRNDAKNVDFLFTSLALQERFQHQKKEAEGKRDKSVQNEIRLLELESVKIEREFFLKFEQEKHAILNLQKQEEENMAIQVQQLSSGVAELVREREQLFQAEQIERQKDERCRKEIDELLDEIKIFKSGIAVQKTEIRQQEDSLKIRLRELQLENGPELRSLQDNLEKIEEKILLEEKDWKEQSSILERDHAQELIKLDSSVKAEVAKRENEIQRLRADITADRARLDKLLTLVDQYRKSDVPNDNTSGKILRDPINRKVSKTSTVSAGVMRSLNMNIALADDVRSTATASTASHSRYSRPLSKTLHK
jgi:hypothetical protein